MSKQELRILIREAIRRRLIESDIIPTGPDGKQISDPKIIKGLNAALKAVDSPIRTKLSDLIQDPGAAKSLSSADKRASMIAAIAIAFGMGEQEFGQVVSKVKSYLPENKNLSEAPATDRDKLNKNIEMALKAIKSSALREKVRGLIEDPSAMKALKNTSQRSAFLVAMATAADIDAKEFGSAIPMVKKNLRKN